MTVALALEEEVVRIICVYDPQRGRTCAEKEGFHDDLGRHGSVHRGCVGIGCVGDLMHMLGNRSRVMRVCMAEMKLGREMWKERCCCRFVKKRSCVWQTHGLEKGEKRKKGT